VQDVYTQGRRTWVWLHKKGGKRHEMPRHHNLDAIPPPGVICVVDPDEKGGPEPPPAG